MFQTSFFFFFCSPSSSSSRVWCVKTICLKWGRCHLRLQKRHKSAQCGWSRLLRIILITIICIREERERSVLFAWLGFTLNYAIIQAWLKRAGRGKTANLHNPFSFFFCLFGICNIIYNIILTEQTELYNTKIPKDRLTPKENSDLVFPS